MDVPSSPARSCGKYGWTGRQGRLRIYFDSYHVCFQVPCLLILLRWARFLEAAELRLVDVRAWIKPEARVCVVTPEKMHHNRGHA